MKRYPILARWLAASASAVVFAVIVLVSGRAGGGKTDDTEIKSTPQSWPMYGGTATRNMVNPYVKGLPAEWSVDDKKNVKWSVALGSKAYGGPTVAGGKVFIGTNNQKPRDPKYTDKGRPIDMGVLMCFDEAGGKFLWQMVFPKLAGGRVNDWPLEGLCASPLVEGDRLYFTSNRCEVVCTDTAGQLQWKLDMIQDLGVFPHNITACSPLLVGNKLFIVTANGVDEGHINVPAPKAPSFLCLDKDQKGKIIWQSNVPSSKLLEVPKEGDQESFFKRLVNRGELLQHGQWSNPAYAVVNGQPQVVFPGGDGWIRSYDPASGNLIWRFDCNPKNSAYELGGKGTRSDFIATPVIHDNKVYIGVGQDPEHELGVGHLWCIDMTKKGDVSPELVTNDSVFPPKTKPNPSSALIWHYGGPADARKLGRNYYFGRTMSTCAIQDGLVYAAELSGLLHCLDAKTGKSYWTHDTKSRIWSSPYVVDNKVYLGTDGGTVFVFAHGKEKKLLAENDMDSPVRATPVAANGTLYVMTENKLFAIANKN